MTSGSVNLETGGKRQKLRVTVPGESTELEHLSWSQVGSAPTARCAHLFPEHSWGRLRCPVVLGGKEDPQGVRERRLKDSEGGRRGPKSTKEVTVIEWAFPYCFICSHVLPWALIFSNLDQRDLKRCHKG